MELTFANIAILIAASQSFLLAVLIFYKYHSVYANRFLAGLMMCYTITLSHLLVQDTGIYRTMPILFLAAGVPLIAFPLHYLYTKYLTNREIKIKLVEFVHFIPFIIFECAIILSIVFSLADIGAVGTSDPASAPLLLKIFNWVIIIQGFTYVGYSFRLIQRFNKRLKDVLSSVEQLQLSWLRNITIAGFSALAVFLIEDIFLTYGINFSNFVFYLPC